jgi:hypothetical protein
MPESTNDAPTRAAVADAFRQRGAAELEHPGGTLLAHLVRTEERLRGYGASDGLALAGLAHAAYGTDGFPTALFELEERDLLRALIGGDAEALVYFYCSCDRGLLYPQLGEERVTFRDRFTDVSRELPIDELRPFLELSFANEIDICNVSDEWRAIVGPEVLAAFAPAAPFVGAEARADLESLRRALAA